MTLRFFAWIVLAFLVMFVLFPLIAITLNIEFSLPVFDYPYLKAIGVILAILGCAILSHCANTLFFRPRQEMPIPLNAPEKFIVAGLYKYVRNPMYLGDFMVILAEFFIFGHLLILVYLLMVMIAVHLMVTRKEEKQLEEKFGKEYKDYRRNVPRWIPRLQVTN